MVWMDRMVGRAGMWKQKCLRARIPCAIFFVLLRRTVFHVFRRHPIQAGTQYSASGATFSNERNTISQSLLPPSLIDVWCLRVGTRSLRETIANRSKTVATRASQQVISIPTNKISLPPGSVDDDMMLRRREGGHVSTPQRQLMREASSLSSSSHGTPLPVLRNHSVAASNGSFVQTYFGRASRASSSSISALSAKTKSTPSWIYYIPALLLIVIPWFSPHALQDQIGRSRMQIRLIQKKQKDLVQQVDAMTKTVQDFQTKIYKLNKENKEKFDGLRESGGIVNQLSLDSEKYREIEKAEEGLFRRLDVLEQHIQKNSAKMVLEKYGPSPHRVKINVVDLRGKVESLILELAPLTEMPHAVYHFLQMVEQNLWDGLVLMLNGGTNHDNINHWMATTMRMDLRFGQHSWEGQRFDDANLSHMAFTEHSTSYPPPGKFQYSVAFSGHPGGPSFYIRMDQNSTEERISDIHQQTSTFGVIVEGVEILERYWKRNEAPNKRKKMTTTTKMQILTFKSMELLRNDDSDSINSNAGATIS